MTIHAKSELCKKGAPLHSKMENTVPTQVLARLLNRPSVIKSFPSRNSICLCLLSTCTSWPRGKVYLPGLPLPFLSKLFILFLSSFSWECAISFSCAFFSDRMERFITEGPAYIFPLPWSSGRSPGLPRHLYVLVLLVYITLPLMPKYH